MDEMYCFGLARRRVSLAVRLYDAYTGTAVTHGCYACIAALKPIIKADGFFVFTDLTQHNVTLTAGGGSFFEERIIITENDSVWSKSPPVYDVYLTPNSAYAVPSRAAYVSERLGYPNSRVYCLPSESGIFINAHTDKDITTDFDDAVFRGGMSGRLLAFADGNGITEMFRMGARVDLDTYLLDNPLTGVCQTAYPVSLGKSDESGYLYMPIWGVKDGVSEALLYDEDMRFSRKAVILRAL